jgi:hypothetical protein
MCRAGADLAGNDKRDWFDGGAVNFVRAHDFAFGDVEGATRKEAQPSLGINRLVF